MKIQHKIVLTVTLGLLFLNFNCFATTESNHSYFTSNIRNDFNFDFRGIGDFKGVYMFGDTNNRDMALERNILVFLTLAYSPNDIIRIGFDYVGNVNNKFGNATAGSLFLEGTIGKFMLGGNSDVTEVLRVGADTIAVGSGGSGGTLVKYVQPAAVNMVDYLVAAGTLMNQNYGLYDNGLKDSWGNKYTIKINYISPEFFGFQWGLSLKPNAKIKKDDNLSAAKWGGVMAMGGADAVSVGTVASTAINYTNTFGDFGFVASFIYEQNFASLLNVSNGAKNNPIMNFRSGEIGLSLSYFGLTLAGSFGLNQRETSNAYLQGLAPKNGMYFGYGAAYEFYKIIVSATFFDGRNSNGKNYGAGFLAFEYKVNKYLLFMLEVAAMEFKDGGNKIHSYSANAGLTINF